MTRRDVQRRVDELRWFHSIPLGDGIVTPGEDDSQKKLERLHLPPNLAGKAVLDVCAWDGFFSFEAERRGAARVVSVDPACWNAPAWGPRGWGTRQGFDLAREILNSDVEPVDLNSLAELSPASLGTFDVVLFLGVLYHLPDPWATLKQVASVTRGHLIVETHADFLGTRAPAVAYYPGSEVEDDESNFWGPNAAMLTAKLREENFSHVRVYTERFPYRVARSISRRFHGNNYKVRQGRLVAQAFRS